MTHPVVGIILPRYGKVHPGSVVAAYEAVDRDAPPEDHVEVYFHHARTSSLLPQCFNSLLVYAYRLRDEGKITHLAMIHDDIFPEQGWLTKLWRLLREHEADVISVCSPLKETPFTDGGIRGRFSTGVGDINDPWRNCKRHVTKQSVKSLPPTFGPEHACGADELLLINTGLWLADLRHPCWDSPMEGMPGSRFSFNILSAIEAGADGDYRDFCIPEDFAWSRHLHEHGARYVATTEVKLQHYGDGVWTNY